MSLTPHEDAARAAVAALSRGKDQEAEARVRISGDALIECARIMDRGEGSAAVMSFVILLTAAMIKSVSQSAFNSDKAAQAQADRFMLGKVAALLECEPSSIVQVAVRGAAPGRA